MAVPRLIRTDDLAARKFEAAGLTWQREPRSR
jgi:hypothetical protein